MQEKNMSSIQTTPAWLSHCSPLFLQRGHCADFCHHSDFCQLRTSPQMELHSTRSCVCLLSLSFMLLTFTPVVLQQKFVDFRRLLCHCINMSQFVYWFYLSCFLVTNNASKKVIYIAVSLWIYVCVSVGFIPQSGIVGHRVCISSAVLDTVKQFSKFYCMTL